MSTAFATAKTDSPAAQFPRAKAPLRSPRIHAVSSGRQDEVLAFLSQRPIETVFMSGLIRDNGLVSFANRGTFFGCRDESDQLTGVALIGPKTVIEARDDLALEAFANLIPNNLTDHLVRGEQQQIEYVLGKYAEAGRVPRVLSREVVLAQVAPAEGVRPEPNLRLAFREDLKSVVSINAATARRIDQGRVWILIEDGQMIFKVDVISETPDAAFLEGVYVQPEYRRQGYGLRCMTQLSRNLLGRFASICLVVNESNQSAQDLYRKAGYEERGRCTTVYFSAV
jgi:uncharacterized protein